LPNRSLSTADHRPPEFGRSELIISDELARLRIYLATLHQINASGKRLSRRQSIGGFYIGKGAAPGLDAWRKKSHVSFTRAHVPRRGILNRDRFGGQLAMTEELTTLANHSGLEGCYRRTDHSKVAANCSNLLVVSK